MYMPMSRNDRSWMCNGWEDTMELKYDGNWYTTYHEFGGAVMLDLHFKHTLILWPLALVVWSASKALAVPYGVQPGIDYMHLYKYWARFCSGIFGYSSWISHKMHSIWAFWWIQKCVWSISCVVRDVYAMLGHKVGTKIGISFGVLQWHFF
jgi:hypothetical protein